MTPKQEAQERVDSFYMGDDFPVECGTYCSGGTPNYMGIAEQCALIAIEREIEGAKGWVDIINAQVQSAGLILDVDLIAWEEHGQVKHLLEVKKEIENK